MKTASWLVEGFHPLISSRFGLFVILGFIVREEDCSRESEVGFRKLRMGPLWLCGFPRDRSERDLRLWAARRQTGGRRAS